MVDIPPEIWVHIAQFIPHDALVKMVSVNSAFHDVALNAKYYNIEDLSTTRILTRLRDPYIARRVRALELKPQLQDKQSSVSKAVSIVSYFFDRMVQNSDTLTLWEKSLPRVLPGLVNLTQLTLDAWTSPPPNYDWPFLSPAAWASFSQLRMFTIRGHVQTIATIIASKPNLASLETLVLEMTVQNPVLNEGAHRDEQAALLSVLSPFLNSLSAHLEQLKIACWGGLDLSALFSQLTAFSRLCNFSLRTSFNVALKDPSGFTRFLVSHSSGLESLDLRLNPTGHNPPQPERDIPLADFLLATVAKECNSSKLQHLQIYPTVLASGFDAVILIINQSAGLRRLAVRDRYLVSDEISDLAIALSSNVVNLVSLRLNIRTLNVELFDILAQNLPELQSLSLFVYEVDGDDAGADLFTQEIRTRSYGHWKLSDIGIWQNTTQLDMARMRAIAGAVPSISSFWDNGHTRSI
ncbi:hypothetical protein C8J56DRAFT_930776 [Mycena floridula]|nr:hypothetical protein C8J56DRAFT_930776 [Mycena floridula]